MVTEDVDFTVPTNRVPSTLIQSELADLREPEGPPPPPGDVPIDAVCDRLAAAAKSYGLPTGFFARLIWQESKFKQRAVSSAGAMGVAQFMPAVAAERGLLNPFDPLAALPHSAQFLKEHVEYFGNLGLAAAAYNGGARRVTDWLARRGKLPEETRNYVKVITGHSPEAWAAHANEIDMPVNLPNRAPCEGVADLSRDAEAAKVAVQLEPAMVKLVEEAKIAAAKAAQAAKVRLAKSKRSRLLAKGKGGQDKASAKVAEKPASKSARQQAKIAERATERSASKRRVKVADTDSRRVR